MNQRTDDKPMLRVPLHLRLTKVRLEWMLVHPTTEWDIGDDVIAVRMLLESFAPPPAATGATPRTDASEAISPYPKFVLAADMRKCERERDDARRELAELKELYNVTKNLIRELAEAKASAWDKGYAAAQADARKILDAAQPPSAAAPQSATRRSIIEEVRDALHDAMPQSRDVGSVEAHTIAMQTMKKMIEAPTGDTESKG